MGFRPGFKPRGKPAGKRSSFEEYVESQLKGQIEYTYEGERLPYTIAHTYKPDFVLSNGVRLEVKGWFTGADRTKLLRVKEANPSVDIRLCFERNSTLNKTSKTTYGDWCDKHGFKWCVVHPLKPRLGIPAKALPKEWLERKP
jgi:hypothetical protein